MATNANAIFRFRLRELQLVAAEGLPSFDGIGPIGDHLHSAREFIVIPTMATRAQIVALFLHRIAAGEIALG